MSHPPVWGIVIPCVGFRHSVLSPPCGPRWGPRWGPLWTFTSLCLKMLRDSLLPFSTTRGLAGALLTPDMDLSVLDSQPPHVAHDDFTRRLLRRGAAVLPKCPPFLALVPRYAPGARRGPGYACACTTALRAHACMPGQFRSRLEYTLLLVALCASAHKYRLFELPPLLSSHRQEFMDP